MTDAHDDRRKLIVFDTDPGVDDAMALAFLARRPELSLIGVTTVLGNARIETVTRNALFLKERLGFAAPVARGAGQTLAGRGDTEALHVHGANGLGDIALPEAIAAAADPRPAHRLIIELVRAHPGRVTLIAVGRMTNLALALREDPRIADLVADVVVMGGAFGTRGHAGNVSPVAEANVQGDPEAADLVFGAPWPVTIVGLDVTQEVVLDAAMLARLRDEGGEDGRFLWDVSRFYHRFHQRSRGLDGIFGHDFLAVAYAVAPDLFKTRSGPVRVVCGGIADGQTIQKPDGAPVPPGAWADRPSQRVCVAVDARAALELYAETFC